MHVVEVQAHEHSIKSDDTEDLTVPFYDTEVFHSIWEALKWKHVRARVPMCFKKLLRSRYMLANLVYLGYVIMLILIDYNLALIIPTTSTDDTDSTSDNTTMMTSILDQSAALTPLVNNSYFGLAITHLVSAFLYWWAWHDKSWLDIIMIPEYLNHIEAALYVWSTSWYSRIDTLGSYYTLTVHKIEMTAATVDLVACFGWIMSWYMTHTRTLGRGFTLDDPDVIAFSSTTVASIVYFVYNIQLQLSPEGYNTNYTYVPGDVLYFIGCCFYIFAGMRDYNCFWFLPLSGQYGVPSGRVHVETKALPQFGQPVVLMTDCCRKRPKKQIKNANHEKMNSDFDIISSYF